jgi:hypothetical protein
VQDGKRVSIREYGYFEERFPINKYTLVLTGCDTNKAFRAGTCNKANNAFHGSVAVDKSKASLSKQ